MSKINDWIDRKILADELHRKVIKKFKRRKVICNHVDDIWASDIVDYSMFSKQNKHFKYLLVVIDCFSKFLFVRMLKTKTGLEVSNAFRDIFKEGRKPNKLWTDKGGEFVNKIMSKLLKEENIELYHTENEEKSCLAERVNRTIKEKISKHFTVTNTTKYYDVLDKIVNEYNNTYHNTIRMTPVEGSKKVNESDIRERVFTEEECRGEKKAKYKTGDRVRITKYKKTFEKGYTSNWTTEIFVIDKVLNTNPITYKLKDLDGEDIIGSFYENELQKTKL